MDQIPLIKVIYSEEVRNFLRELPEAAREKIIYNIDKVSGGFKDIELFKKLDDIDGIWEFRTLFNKVRYRLLAFWDTDQEALVITTNGFIKKQQKTPTKEIRRAQEIKKLYFEQKKK